MKSLEYQCLDFWRSKPAWKSYDGSCIGECALAQFAESLGAQNYGDSWWQDAGGEIQAYDRRLYNAAMCIGFSGLGWTFGAAADRLEKLLQP